MVQYAFDENGGFVVKSANGNFRYAYPTSPNAIEAKKRPAEVAERLAAEADETSVWSSRKLLRDYNRHMAVKMSPLSAVA